MDNQTKTIIGYIGGTLLNITFIPQIYKTFKTKKTDDISIYFMGSQMITSIFCLSYAILLDENPLILSNSILFVELFILFIGKIMYSHIYKKKEIMSEHKITSV
jgi:MtN3 and saliva related transmembrane protein